MVISKPHRLERKNNPFVGLKCLSFLHWGICLFVTVALLFGLMVAKDQSITVILNFFVRQ